MPGYEKSYPQKDIGPCCESPHAARVDDYEDELQTARVERRSEADIMTSSSSNMEERPPLPYGLF